MILDEDIETPVDLILEEQRSLTAVERFSKKHAGDSLPAQERYYRDLLPTGRPEFGQQYAFEVDLDTCSGCQACVTACHSLNGLDDDESWRKIGLLQSEDWRTPYQATVTTACHHCVDPGCMKGCPVLAYEKDPFTGIVRHLDDQCIGCRYCVMTCPYEVPQYSRERGIVRKCDMCAGRLEHGEAPACVQACPNEAIRITVVDQASLADGYRRSAPAPFLPASPDPGLTLPTTRYRTARPAPPEAVAGDQARFGPSESHPSLMALLILSQFAVGSAGAALVAGSRQPYAAIAAVAAPFAAVVGILHLGRPWQAWRSFLGWRTSWFSREVIAFGLFIPLSALSALSYGTAFDARWRLGLAAASAAVGLAGVLCSAMIYVETGRSFWNLPSCLGRFLGTTVLFGLAVAWARNATGGGTRAGAVLALGLVAVAVAKLSLEHGVLRHFQGPDEPARRQLERTASLLLGPLHPLVRARVALGVVGCIALPGVATLALAVSAPAPAWVAWTGVAMCVIGEALERHLFFAAVSPDRMPGGRAA